MKRLKEPILLGLGLGAGSLLLYLIHYLVAQDVKQTFLTFLGNLAFVPVSLLLVTLIIDRLLREREQRALRKKLNMVIGAFFSEVGSHLLERFSRLDLRTEQNRQYFIVGKDWSEREFRGARKQAENYDSQISAHMSDLEEVRTFLVGKANFLLRLLENPILLEDAAFTELLWAVFHLREELSYRSNLRQLPEADYEHLSGDIKRIYRLLVREWLGYLKHLKENYPYLFSLALRTNPFDPNAFPEVH